MQVGTVDLWYRRTYRLPPNHPLYLATTLEERLTEYWANRYQDDPKLMEVVEDADFDIEAIQQQWAEEAENQNLNNVDDWEDVKNGD